MPREFPEAGKEGIAFSNPSNFMNKMLIIVKTRRFLVKPAGFVNFL